MLCTVFRDCDSRWSYVKYLVLYTLKCSNWPATLHAVHLAYSESGFCFTCAAHKQLCALCILFIFFLPSWQYLYIFANSTGIITLNPCHGNVLGGSPIVVSGPYFTVQEADQITCLFNGTAVDGIFVNNQQVLCVSPTLSQTGRVPFQLFVRGNTTFYGESVFVSGRLDVHMISAFG